MYNGEERRKKKKFLIIDDDEDTLALYKTIAKHHNISVETTSKASEFIELFNGGGFDVALVDYVMPIDGISISRLLKKDKQPNTKIYFITSHDESTVRNKINGDKYDGIMSKELGFNNILSHCIEELVHERV